MWASRIYLLRARKEMCISVASAQKYELYFNCDIHCRILPNSWIWRLVL